MGRVTNATYAKTATTVTGHTHTNAHTQNRTHAQKKYSVKERGRNERQLFFERIKCFSFWWSSPATVVSRVGPTGAIGERTLFGPGLRQCGSIQEQHVRCCQQRGHISTLHARARSPEAIPKHLQPFSSHSQTARATVCTLSPLSRVDCRAALWSAAGAVARLARRCPNPGLSLAKWRARTTKREHLATFQALEA